MAPQTFKDENILIVAPGSHITLAQQGLPESFTPARHRIKSRMFPGQNKGEYEPFKFRHKWQTNSGPSEISNENTNDDENVIYEEDTSSDEGAVWPIRKGSIVDWDCFFALLNHAINVMGSPFHAPILLIAEPAWTPKDHERIAQFIFEKIKPPAFTIMDAAQAACYAYGLSTATIVDIGEEKADITAVTDFLVHDIGRSVAISDCGGEAMTRRLQELLRPKGFTRDMCEQLKRSPICEILPAGTPLPTPGIVQNGHVDNPAATASTGADGPGPNQRNTPASQGAAPRGHGEDTEVGIDDAKDDEENEGVLDVASIVTGGKMAEFLERKEKEKAAKAASRKKGADIPSGPKPVRLKNSEKEKSTFIYEDYALMEALKNSDADSGRIEETKAAFDEGRSKPGGDTSPVEVNGSSSGSIRREITVGVERFQALTGSLLTDLTSAIHRTILSAPIPSKRGELWDSIIVVGNGSAVKGFKEALLSSLNSRFLISPSSATIFTSELPSNFSTPIATGANTPQPPEHRQAQPHGVNPLLHAATTASYQQQQMGGTHNQHLHPQSAAMHHPQPQHHHPPPQQHTTHHTSHSQSPASIKLARLPEYFSEWKEHGHEEAMFLGAQVAAKVIFVVDTSSSASMGKAFLLRSEYNEQGPTAIHEYTM